MYVNVVKENTYKNKRDIESKLFDSMNLPPLIKRRQVRQFGVEVMALFWSQLKES